MRSPDSMEPKGKQSTKGEKIGRLSGYSPIVTALIGARILFITTIRGTGSDLSTAMRKALAGNDDQSRSVDVGVVESATLTDDRFMYQIKARLHSGMEKLLHKGSVFWV